LERIREERDAANLSRRELAKRTGISSSTIYRWETGQAIPSAGGLDQIAHALHVHIGIFISGDERLRGEYERYVSEQRFRHERAGRRATRYREQRNHLDWWRQRLKVPRPPRPRPPDDEREEGGSFESRWAAAAAVAAEAAASDPGVEPMSDGGC
jgi:transcriptional regulator with XRE-family HTH domain